MSRSHPQPQWLQPSLQPSHLALAVRTLESRESQRASARIIQSSSSPPSHRPRLPRFQLSRPSNALKFHYSCSIAQHPSHKRENRYLGVEPYDRTRVCVPNPRVASQGDAASATRYLNANWVRESVGGKWWIAAQAPLPNTAHAFLSLGMCPVTPAPIASLPPRRVHTIVQVTLMIEGGRRRAHPYFGAPLQDDMILPPEPGCSAPPIHVHVVNEERIDDAQCVKTDLRLRWAGAHGSEEEWAVTHLLYTAWPDFGVPEDNRSILNFARLVERVNNRHLTQSSEAADPNASPPMILHCSAGVGRTGSFIALSSLLRAYSLLAPPSPARTSSQLMLAPALPASPLGALPGGLGQDLVAREIDGAREQRMAMVQREEQVVWVYEALSDAFDGL